MKDILISIATGVCSILAMSVLTLLARLLHEKFVALRAKTDNDGIKLLIEKIDYIVQLCVESTNQTYVDQLKKDGKFDVDNQKEAFKKTFTAIECMLTESDKQEIISTFGDISTFITTSVENYIKTSKTE